jgi:hypothetical protein
METKKTALKKTTTTVATEANAPVRKSAITLYWEKRRKLGYSKGTIYNMRAVLK